MAFARLVQEHRRRLAVERSDVRDERGDNVVDTLLLGAVGPTAGEIRLSEDQRWLISADFGDMPRRGWRGTTSGEQSNDDAGPEPHTPYTPVTPDS